MVRRKNITDADGDCVEVGDMTVHGALLGVELDRQLKALRSCKMR